MSDLSHPPLSLLPKEVPVGGSAAFRWPTPPFAMYPGPGAPLRGEPCEIEGGNGKVSQGRLVSIDPAAGLAQVQVPPARGNLPLRFTHFRRLTLTDALAPGCCWPTARTTTWWPIARA